MRDGEEEDVQDMRIIQDGEIGVVCVCVLVVVACARNFHHGCK